jgi:hypothetical protein
MSKAPSNPSSNNHLMPETISITLEIPKELVARIKAVKPPWLADLTDEEYLSHVIARGTFDDYLQQLESANAAVKKLAADLNLGGRSGPAQSKRTKAGQRAGNKASLGQPEEKTATMPIT